MSFSPAQKSFLRLCNGDTNGIVYLSDRIGLLNTTQRASAFWRTGRALEARGIVTKVPGVDAFQLRIKVSR